MPPSSGRSLGKGDAMWRALAAARGDLVAYIDSDTRGFDPAFVAGLFGPLICEPGDVQFVKGAYRRPFTAGDVVVPDGGGRVSQLTARPLLDAFYPDLAGLAPAAGGRDRRAARAARAAPLRHRLRRRDGDADRRPRARRRQARSPRSTSASGATATSRCPPCARWPTKSSPCEPASASAAPRPRCRRTAAPSTPSSDPRRAPPFSRADGARATAAAASLGSTADGPALRLHRPRRHAARPRRVALPRRRGRVHAARRPGARGLPPRRGRGRADLRAPARPGRRAGAADRRDRLLLRDRRRAGHRRRGDLALRRVPAARRTDAVGAGRGGGRAGAAAGAPTPTRSSPTRPGTSAARSPTSSAARSTSPRPTRCSPSNGHAGVRLLDNGTHRCRAAAATTWLRRRRRRPQPSPRTCGRAATPPPR